MEVDPKPEPRWPWVLWGLTTLSTLALCTFLRALIVLAQLCYEQMQLTSLPFLARLLLVYGPSVWVVAVAASIAGVHVMRRHGARTVIPWCLFTLVILLAIAAFVAYGLVPPLVVTQSRLSR